MNQPVLGRRQFSVGLGAAALGGFQLAHAQSEGRIVLGQSAAFTGPAAQLGVQFNLGAKLFFDQLNAQGGVIDDLIIYFLRDDWFRVVVNASTAEKDLAWMEKVRSERAFTVTITPRRDLAMIAVQGPNARAKFWQVRPATQAATENLGAFFAAAVGDLFVARSGWVGQGFSGAWVRLRSRRSDCCNTTAPLKRKGSTANSWIRDLPALQPSRTLEPGHSESSCCRRSKG